MLFERKKAENTATAALVQNLRDAISTKDSLIESLKKDIGANEEQTKKVFFYFGAFLFLLVTLLGIVPSKRKFIKFDPLCCLRVIVFIFDPLVFSNTFRKVSGRQVYQIFYIRTCLLQTPKWIKVKNFVIDPLFFEWVSR